MKTLAKRPRLLIAGAAFAACAACAVAAEAFAQAWPAKPVAGKLRAVAVTGDKRSQSMPDVPALAELGFPGFSALAWWGVFAPAATPRPIVDRLNAEFGKALNQPDLRRQLTEQLGMDVAGGSPEALQQLLLAEMARWAKVVKQYNIEGDS
jgi:tripartite-type tricarboxylate transporter receptor subunit TctC